MADVADILGLDMSDVRALADAICGPEGDVGFRRLDVDDLVNRLHASAIPVASGVDAPSLVDAVASCGLGPWGWPRSLRVGSTSFAEAARAQGRRSVPFSRPRSISSEMWSWFRRLGVGQAQAT